MGNLHVAPDVLAAVRSKYPVGCRVELCRMNDDQAPPVGTLGTVKGVDDIGSLLVKWDTGSGLSSLYCIDLVRKVDAGEGRCDSVEHNGTVYTLIEAPHIAQRGAPAEAYFEAHAIVGKPDAEGYTPAYRLTWAIIDPESDGDQCDWAHPEDVTPHGELTPDGRIV